MGESAMKDPCVQCGDEFTHQVKGVCFNCITRPLLDDKERDAHDHQVAERRLRVNCPGGQT